MEKHNTDVPASIAGYFYQFLLAVQELTNLLSCGHIDDLVGIEQGADVRIFKRGNNKKSLEAKFYKDAEFNRRHSSISHTIYNFYTSFLLATEAGQSIDDYEYRTNVPITAEDKQFFDKWNDPNTWTEEETKKFIEYIKESIVRDRLKTEAAKKVIPQMNVDIQEMQMNAVLSELIDGTSTLIPILQQTAQGNEAYECFKGTDRASKVEKLTEIIETVAYTKLRSKERREVRPTIEQLQERIKKPEREQLIAAILNGEMSQKYMSIISYKVDDENKPNKKRDCELDLTVETLFETFARKVRFRFGDYMKAKITYINEVQGNICEKIQAYDPQLQINDCHKIINAIIEKLFRTTVDDTQGISVGELKGLIQHHNDIVENKKLTMIMESYNNAMKSNRRAMLHVMGDDIARELERSIMQSWEQYYESANLMGVSELNNRFKVNHNEISIEELLEVLIHISLLEHFGEKPLSVSFKEEIMSGVNNVKLAANNQYLFKTIKGTFSKKTELVVYDFIDYMYRYHIEKVAGNEHVLFFSDVTSPTPINIAEDSVILDIARVEEQENLLLLFGGMNFSWHSQIDLDESHEKNKQSAIDFIGGIIGGTDFRKFTNRMVSNRI